MVIKLKKKEKKKLTKKQIIIFIIATIILSILCYFITIEITKSIIDHKTVAKWEKEDSYSDLIEVDTIDNISLQDLINNFNEITDEDINIEDINNNKITIDNIELIFNLKDDNNINIVSINFNNKNNKVKELISNMIIANNDDIDNDTVDLIYNKVFETLGNTTNNDSKTSEFFQYQGLEFSLKEYNNNDYKYSFRIGRITEKNKSDE